MEICSDYLSKVLDIKVLPKVVARMVKEIKDSEFEYDSIAFCGNSGALVAPLVALKLNKHLLMIRKGKSHHSTYQVEGNMKSKRYIIIDDLIFSGSTIRFIIRNIKKWPKEIERASYYWGSGSNIGKYMKPELVGIFLYNSCRRCSFVVDKKNYPVRAFTGIGKV